MNLDTLKKAKQIQQDIKFLQETALLVSNELSENVKESFRLWKLDKINELKTEFNKL